VQTHHCPVTSEHQLPLPLSPSPLQVALDMMVTSALATMGLGIS
jgi:hypothetical protein